MKKTFLILLFIASFNSYSQKKEVVYVDANDNEITAKQYKSLDKKVFFVRETENDTAIVKRIFLHRIYGKLDTIQHSKINTYLEKIIGKEYDRNKKSVIHLYRKNDGKILNDAQYNKFWGYIKDILMNCRLF